MATNVSTVSLTDTSSETSGDGQWYTDFASWEASQRDLTGTDGEDVIFYDEWPAGLPTAIVIDWAGTAENTSPIRIIAAAGQEYDPIADTGPFATVDGDNVFEVAANVYIEFHSIGVKSGARAGISSSRNASSSTVAIKTNRCYLESAGTLTTRACLYSARDVRAGIESCIFRYTGTNPAIGALVEDMRGASDGYVRNTLLIHNVNLGSPYHASAAVTNPVNWQNVVLFNADESQAYGHQINAITGGTTHTAVSGTELPTGEANGVTGLTKADFENFDLSDFHPAASGLLDGSGTNSVLPLNDFDNLPFNDPPSRGAYEIVGGAPGVTFDGPDIVDQAGTEGQVFSFDENGEGTVASRFTGATSYAYAPGSDQPAGITVNATTGNLEGTPTSPGSYDVTIEGSD